MSTTPLTVQAGYTPCGARGVLKQVRRAALRWHPRGRTAHRRWAYPFTTHRSMSSPVKQSTLRSEVHRHSTSVALYPPSAVFPLHPVGYVVVNPRSFTPYPSLHDLRTTSNNSATSSRATTPPKRMHTRLIRTSFPRRMGMSRTTRPSNCQAFTCMWNVQNAADARPDHAFTPVHLAPWRPSSSRRLMTTRTPCHPTIPSSMRRLLQRRLPKRGETEGKSLKLVHMHTSVDHCSPESDSRLD
jgi:hypothetical protein